HGGLERAGELRSGGWRGEVRAPLLMGLGARARPPAHGPGGLGALRRSEGSRPTAGRGPQGKGLHGVGRHPEGAHRDGPRGHGHPRRDRGPASRLVEPHRPSVLATLVRRISVVPSYSRMARTSRYQASMPSSVMNPFPPWTWMARSATRPTISVDTSLAMAAWRRPSAPWSISRAHR